MNILVTGGPGPIRCDLIEIGAGNTEQRWSPLWTDESGSVQALCYPCRLLNS